MWTEQDLTVSLPAACLCVEMALVALLHIYAYPLGPYRVWRRPRASENLVVKDVKTYTGIGLAVVALVEMLNVLDLVEGIGRAFKYMIFDIRKRHHEIGYADNHVVQRHDRIPRPDIDKVNQLSTMSSSEHKKPYIDLSEIKIDVISPRPALVAR